MMSKRGNLRVISCLNPECRRDFSTTRGDKKYCSRKCKRNHAEQRRTDRDPQAKRNRSRMWRDKTDMVGYFKEYTYRMTLDEFVRRLATQSYRCLVCHVLFTDKDKICVDHDHACCDRTPTCGNCTRGLIHDACNRALGIFRDDPVKFRLAAEYLEGSWKTLSQEFGLAQTKTLRKQSDEIIPE